MKNKMFVFGLLVLLVVVFFLLPKSRSRVIQNRFPVTTSFYPLYFFTSQVAGDKANVINITPAGAEPHDYEPTPQDIAYMQNSKLLVIQGLLEPWADKVKQNLSSSTKIVVAAEGLESRQLEEEGKMSADPHTWLAPLLAKKEVQNITNALILIDQTNKEYYQNNAALLNQKLSQLDALYKEGLKSCKLHDIITSHAAFGYLAEAYGLNQVSIAGLSPDAEPSAQQLASIAQFAKKNNVKYIFFESLVSPKLSETIASEVGAKTLVLNPLEGITQDELGEGKTYFSEMEQNLKNLQFALECTSAR